MCSSTLAEGPSLDDGGLLERERKRGMQEGRGKVENQVVDELWG